MAMWAALYFRERHSLDLLGFDDIALCLYRMCCGMAHAGISPKRCLRRRAQRAPKEEALYKRILHDVFVAVRRRRTELLVGEQETWLKILNVNQG